jgi:eukaryotic-like serine/threonine-protein kinase
VESEAEQELTKAGLFMGSPKYMSPEQIRGERVDARSDIYALGVVMYEMITGRVPFERDNTVKVLMAHMHEQVPPIATPDVPQPLIELVMRCLDKRPDGRPASMDEVILRLKQAMGLSLTTSGAFALGPDMRLPPLGSQTGRIPTMTGGQYRPGAYSMMNTLTGEIMSPLARNVQTQSGYTTGQPGQPQGLPAFTPAHIPGMITQPIMTGAMPPMHSQSQPPPAAAPKTPWLPRVVVVASLFVAAGFLALRFTEQGQTLVLTRTGPALNAPAQPNPPSGWPAQPQVAPGLGGDPTAPAPAPAQAAPAQHHVVVTLSTVPAGAYVWADDKPYGQTPANIEWWGDQAAPGREVRFTFSRDGYEKATVVRSITGEKLDVEAVLNRVPFVPRRRATAPTGDGDAPAPAAPVAPAAAPAGPAAKPGDAASHSGVNVVPDEFKSDPY